MIPLNTEEDAVRYLRTPAAIRDRCGLLFDAVLEGKSNHYRLDLSRLPDVVRRVEGELVNHYPSLDVPYHSRWRHFDVANVDRSSLLSDELADIGVEDRARAKLELAIVSVLLDAGAGDGWSYREPGTNLRLSRSEGLAVASLHAFIAGAFGEPNAVTGDGLESITRSDIDSFFQVSETNPLAGADGRAELLNRLGRIVKDRPEVFGDVSPRLGNILSAIERVEAGGRVRASDLLGVVLSVFSPIWPGRITLAGENLGDVWRHSRISTNDASTGLVPFHKLSQWLTYSLFEPLEEAGVVITGIDELTGLAEYRNGGLFVDAGVIVPREGVDLAARHQPSSELVVEWRAMTVVLLDRTAAELRAKLGKTKEELPLAKVLQGGTWSAGRRIAGELRPLGGPPILIESDGTVF